MKKYFTLIATLLLTLTLVACNTQNNANDKNANQAGQGTTNNEAANNNTTVDQNTNTNTNTVNTTENDAMIKKMGELDYTDFELEVDYGENKEYEAEIELNNGLIKADLHDELNGVNTIGEEAFNTIFPNVKKLTIDRNTNNDDAIKQVLDAFSLDANYREIDIDITFTDGTKMNFSDMK